MTIRTVTLTAVAALSLGMAAHAQDTRTVTVPLNEPGTAAPAPTGPGTTVVVNPDGTTTVEVTGADAPAATAEPAAAEPAAAEVTPAPEPAAEPAADAQPAQVDADSAADPAVSEGTPAEAPADTAPAAIQNSETAAEGEAGADVSAATEPAAEPAEAEAPAAEAEAEAPAAEAEAEAEAHAETGTAEGEHAAAEGEHAAEGEGEAHGGGHGGHIEDVAFSFEGPFGTYDQFQLQRGLQVYTEVCAGCHGMKQVPLRTLADQGGPGLPEDQVRAYAAEMSIVDKETGEERPRVPTDHFPTVTGEGMGPDLSLMAKARAGFHGPVGTGLSQLVNGIGGPEYIHAILTGYTGETKEEAGATFYENTAFASGWIAMPPPLSDDQVTFEDGAPADLDSAAKDVSAFLMWTAEPKMMARKQVGLVSVLFLIVLSALLYLTNKRLWWPLKHGRDTLDDGR